ncbi:carboxylating nicotinate-nucleotide diphosphorylase [Salibacter halophilus]|uniref:Probable nicotinate-nucleotide pyrophosphorylase [carboxylating] n=1 Tax=Salibacter halophilus TaxID=1803916 RepID=A0A6N6M589_9FLAO|nr:carboxylating nicotinate-nucleotide diphosphorylase [Salibacter halophilus]KAB1062671.1 carboxylating nicotinate-nucleotide diphosphorylase [Salibacter halophilus]
MNISTFIDEAIKEDIGDGDHTSLACIPSSAKGKAKLLVKENGILAGIEIAKKVFEKFDPSVNLEFKLNDGDQIENGDIAFTAEGSSRNILQAERLTLNLMQRMSGIATLTNQYVQKCEGTKAKILDTRKTTPNLREFEKMAVKIGGGHNHRFGLFDMIMIKDNHIDFAGGIKQALEKTQEYLSKNNKDLRIEIEARDLKEVEEILSVGIGNRIMLDNFNYEDTKKAVALIGSRYETESSGGINLDTVGEYAKCGVDFISVGALTHSATGLDLSLKAM